MGRRQTTSGFFKDIEKSWRKELVRIATVHNFQFVLIFLILDTIARGIATIKIKFSHKPHLWSPVETTKSVQFSHITIPINKTEI